MAISQYLGCVITEKNGEIATLSLVARNDAGESCYMPRLPDFHAHGRVRRRMGYSRPRSASRAGSSGNPELP